LIKNLTIPGLEIHEMFNRTGNDVVRASNSAQIPAIHIQFFRPAYLGSAPYPVPYPQPLPPVPVPPQPYNPFIGLWEAAIISNDEKLTCILSFSADNEINVIQYDTNTITRKTIVGLYYWHTSDRDRGSGSGTYTFQDNGKDFTIEIKLNISYVPSVFSRVSVMGTLSKASPDTFTVSGSAMNCEYLIKSREFRDYYYKFYKRSLEIKRR
jgi:hypothetical protein